MLNIFGNKSELGPGEGELSGFQAVDALYERELQANLAALNQQRRKSRRYQSANNWSEYWPFALGIAISCFVPQLRDFVELYRPWGMWILFPFASILTQPQVSFSNQIAGNLPLFFMFAQFPIEGFMARWALRGNVTFLRVFGQVLCLHLFALLELWLVNSPFGT